MLLKMDQWFETARYLNHDSNLITCNSFANDPDIHREVDLSPEMETNTIDAH